MVQQIARILVLLWTSFAFSFPIFAIPPLLLRVGEKSSISSKTKNVFSQTFPQEDYCLFIQVLIENELEILYKKNSRIKFKIITQKTLQMLCSFELGIWENSFNN
jgi:hypothetical protein